jgi:hypothetical protein
MKRYKILMFFLFALSFGAIVASRTDDKASGKEQAETLPYPETIRSANIKIDKLDSPMLHGMIQANGDLHSFFYAKYKQIILRLAKNDVYDALIDTKDDPELAKIRNRVEKASLCVYRAKLSIATMEMKYANGLCKPSLKECFDQGRP